MHNKNNTALETNKATQLSEVCSKKSSWKLPLTDSWPFILVQLQPQMVEFGMGLSWSANQQLSHSAKENVDYFLDKGPEDVLLLLQMYLQPTTNFVHAAVQHISQAMPIVGVIMDTHLFVCADAIEEATCCNFGKQALLWICLTPALCWTLQPQPCLLTKDCCSGRQRLWTMGCFRWLLQPFSYPRWQPVIVEHHTVSLCSPNTWFPPGTTGQWDCAYMDCLVLSQLHSTWISLFGGGGLGPAMIPARQAKCLLENAQGHKYLH